MSTDTVQGGERPGYREGRDRMVEHLIKHGEPGIRGNPDVARRIADEAARRHDTGEAWGGRRR